MPATSMAMPLLLMLVSLLVMEPDFGQTMLILMVWGTLFFIAGMRMIWVAGLAGAAAAGLFGAYMFVPHVAGRIKRFMNPASGDTFQVDTAMEAFYNGGWFGLGPGEGIAKRILPDSHTDFVFAVAAEEFGIILCLVLLALFAFIVIRALMRAYNEDMFARFAASGLAIMFGVQAAINMSVNLQLIPAKGMTLPFISYGGSPSSRSLWRRHAAGADAAATARRVGIDRHRGYAVSYAKRSVRNDGIPVRIPHEYLPLILLAAGGTGGHLFPAEALGVELIKRGYRVRLVTDDRALRYSGLFTQRHDRRGRERDRARPQSVAACATRPSRWPRAR